MPGLRRFCTSCCVRREPVELEGLAVDLVVELLELVDRRLLSCPATAKPQRQPADIDLVEMMPLSPSLCGGSMRYIVRGLSWSGSTKMPCSTGVSPAFAPLIWSAMVVHLGHLLQTRPAPFLLRLEEIRLLFLGELRLNL